MHFRFYAFLQFVFCALCFSAVAKGEATKARACHDRCLKTNVMCYFSGGHGCRDVYQSCQDTCFEESEWDALVRSAQSDTASDAQAGKSSLGDNEEMLQDPYSKEYGKEISAGTSPGVTVANNRDDVESRPTKEFTDISEEDSLDDGVEEVIFLLDR